MGQTAVDVAILPEAAVSDRAVSMNAALVAGGNREIMLGAGMCLPHISLCMGCLDEADVESAGAVVREIAARKLVSGLRITQTHVRKNAQGRDVSYYVVERTRELQKLHELVMLRMGPILSYDVSPEMLCGDGPIADTTLEWIRTYPEEASFEKFLPHITLGYGAVGNDTALPMDSGPGRLALCKLGNHCTCREVLAAAGL